MASNRDEKGRALTALVFIALWLDGSFYPLILLPLLFTLYYMNEGLHTIGLGRAGLRPSIVLGLGVGLAVAVVYYPIFIHYLSRRPGEGSSFFALFTDLVWYPIYEEISYRGFFLGSFAEGRGRLSGRSLYLNLVQSMLFVLVHQNHISAGLHLLLIPILLLGFSMGLVFLRTRNIAGCILGHSLVNGVSHLLYLMVGNG